MIWIKILRSLVKTLNSDGTPGQVALGFVLGSMMGLTPLFTLQHLVIIVVVTLTNVSFPAAMLGWLAFVPVGFLVDPGLDALGAFLLLDTTALHGAWERAANTPILALSDLNNTVTLGSLAAWVVLSVPMFYLVRWAVARYRSTVYERWKKSKWFKAVKSSKLYDIYRLFQPG